MDGKKRLYEAGAFERAKRNRTSNDCLQSMQQPILEFTRAAEVGDFSTIEFEPSYRSVYQATIHGFGNLWHLEVTHAAKKLAFKLRNDKAAFRFAAEAIRDVSLYACAVFCAKGRPTVIPMFEKAWEEWQGDRAHRAWVLWERVRKKRPLLAAVATFVKIHEDVRFRPGNSGFLDAKNHYESVSNAI